MLFQKTNAPKSADIYIDLGTANTLVVTRARGLVANEPSVIAYRETFSGGKTIFAIGNQAKDLIGRTADNITASLPMKEGVIADMDTTEAMLRYFLSRVPRTFRFTRPRVIISLPYGVRDTERKAVIAAGVSSGAGEVILVEEPMIAALGSGLPVHAANGNMIIDIGGGTTEVAVISLYGIVHCESLRIGGHAFDRAIVQYMRRRFNLVIGDQTAERAKIQIGSALRTNAFGETSIRGVDFVTGLPKEAVVTAVQINEAINDLLNQIYEAAKRTLEHTPPDLLSDIIRDGITVVGGGALIRDLDTRLSEELNLPVRIADDPLQAIAKGGVLALNDPELLERMTLTHHWSH